ncbi:MAG: FkbM family methyltransferase [Chloroflexota bacterium]|nr:FkbM family methyltransferase [Chloroflexota bacterium]
MNMSGAWWRRQLAALLRRVRQRVVRARPSEPSWQKVESGPLAGTFFLLPSGQGAEWTERFIQGRYETAMLTALGELARQGGVLYDVGAHMGYYACAWLALGGARVEAFEPAPFNRRVLEETLARNRLSDKVRVHGVALGDTNGQATLVISEADIGAASAAYLDQPGGSGALTGSAHFPLPNSKRITVPVRKLDDLFEEMSLPAPTTVKLDVEGAEAHVLAGAGRVISEFRPAILCEVHSTEGGMQVAHRMAKLGYELTILGKNGNETACIWLSPGVRGQGSGLKKQR